METIRPNVIQHQSIGIKGEIDDVICVFTCFFNIYTKKWLKNFDDYIEDGKEDLFNGNNLMKPIVDLGISRNQALERFSRIK